MKVGIMSMQRIINYGSFLQAFGLSNIIKSLGHEVEFVDFEVEPCAIEPETKEYIAKSEKDISGLKQWVTFEKKFEQEYLKDLNVTSKNIRPHLDTLVIGSDEVFNCLQANPQVGYSKELFGYNNNAKKVISYAASCGTTTVQRLKEHGKASEISDLLSKFHSISVRDSNSKHLVSELTGFTPQNHLDPVLVYDFENDIIDNVNLKDYIIVYAYTCRFNDEECEAIKKFAKKHNKKIVSIGHYQRCCDIYIPAHPLEVLAYFKKADFIITDTFHGTIFSIKAHKPFATLIRESNKQKLFDLLERLGLLEREVTDLEHLESILHSDIDYDKVEEILNYEKTRTLEYLKENL